MKSDCLNLFCRIAAIPTPPLRNIIFHWILILLLDDMRHKILETKRLPRDKKYLFSGRKTACWKQIVVLAVIPHPLSVFRIWDLRPDSLFSNENLSQDTEFALRWYLRQYFRNIKRLHFFTRTVLEINNLVIFLGLWYPFFYKMRALIKAQKNRKKEFEITT